MKDYIQSPDITWATLYLGSFVISAAFGFIVLQVNDALLYIKMENMAKDLKLKPKFFSIVKLYFTLYFRYHIFYFYDAKWNVPVQKIWSAGNWFGPTLI